MKLWVVSTLTQSPGTELVLDSARRRGHDVRRVHPLHVGVLMGGQATFGFWEDGQRLEPPDGIFTRMGAVAPLRAFVLLRAALHLSIPVINHPDGLTWARNKILTAQRLVARGLPCPETLAISANLRASEVEAALGPGPWVLKEAVGSKGASVHLVHDHREMKAILRDNPMPEGGWLVQRFIREAAGSDLRVLVIGGRARAAMRRRGKPGDFRSNLHQGGQGEPYELHPEICDLAESAAAALGLSVAGVDILESDTGLQVLEVNGSPGFAGITGALERDLAGELLEFLEAEWRAAPPQAH